MPALAWGTVSLTEKQVRYTLTPEQLSDRGDFRLGQFLFSYASTQRAGWWCTWIAPAIIP